MKQLFLRIFLSFWAAMAVVAAILVISSPYFTRSHPGLERWQRGAERVLGERLAAGVELITQRGLPRRWDQRGMEGAGGGGSRRGRPVAPSFVFTPMGQQVAGPEAPQEVVTFAARVVAAGEEVSGRDGVVVMAGRPVTAPDGTRLILVTAARMPPRPVDLLEPGALWWRLGLVAGVVGALCLWLAHGLAAPLEKLRVVVRRLADGDLSARAGRLLTRRRDEVGELAREFDAMAGQMQSLVDAQRRLVRDVSHELRSPLARLAVALELARRQGGGESGEALDRIEREAARLEEMIAQLLTLSRLEVATAPAVREPVDLAALLQEVAEDAAFEAGSREVGVEVEAVPAIAFGDAEALRRAVENVVRNAITFTPAGTHVVITLQQELNALVVRVRDAGDGLPDEMLENVFEPFVRADSARDRARGGVGLGLAIAARAVRLHGGTIRAANVSGGGLEVTLRLPAAVGPTPPAGSDPLASPAGSEAS